MFYHFGLGQCHMSMGDDSEHDMTKRAVFDCLLSKTKSRLKGCEWCVLLAGDLAGAAKGVQSVVEAADATGGPCDVPLLLHLATLRSRCIPGQFFLALVRLSMQKFLSCCKV